MNSTVEIGGMKELEFGGALPCISERCESKWSLLVEE